MGMSASSSAGVQETVCEPATLFTAALHADLSALITCLNQNGERADATADFDVSLLHFAAANKAHGREIVRFLISKGIVPNQVDKIGEEPIHYAIRAGNLAVIEEILNVRGADVALFHYCVKRKRLEAAKLVHASKNEVVQGIDVTGRTVLHLAAELADLETCVWLIERGVNVSFLCVSTGDNALHSAARNGISGWGVIRCLGYFVPSEMDVNESNYFKFTPLHVALADENIRAAEQLVKLGAEVKVQLLDFCIQRNKLRSAKFVVNQCKDSQEYLVANIQRLDTTAAHHAGVDMCSWLLEQGPGTRVKRFQLGLHDAPLNFNHGAQLCRYFIESWIIVSGENKKDDLNRTPLSIALQVGNVECVTALRQHGARLGMDGYNENCFHFCVEKNSLACAKMFPFEPYRNYQPILHLAALHADHRMCQWLIEQGADLLNEETGETALHLAVRNRPHGNKVVEYLVSIGTDVNRKNKFQETPLFVALKEENLDLVEKLLNLGVALIAPFGETLLVSCVRLKKMKSAEFLLKIDKHTIADYGARGETVLHVAAEKCDLETCQWLLRNGANPHVLTDDGDSMMHLAAGNRVNQGKQLVRYFHSLGLDVNARNHAWETPLHCALIKGNEDVVPELWRLGADLGVKINNENLLHDCVRLARHQSAKFLLSRCPRLIAEVDSKGRTPLHHAAMLEDVAFCEWFIEEGVDVNAVTKDGQKAFNMLPRRSRAL